MAAIVTNNFRRENAQEWVNKLTNTPSTDNYFVGFGKSDSWPNEEIPTIPSNTETENRDVLRNLIGLIRINTNANHSTAKSIVPRNEWATGRRYKAYDPADIDNFNSTSVNGDTIYPSYVISNQKIYLCLKSGWDGNQNKAEASSVNPISNNNNNYGWEEMSDNYVWSYIGAITPTTNDFNTEQFIEVPDDDDASNKPTEGLLYGFHVEDGTYTGDPDNTSFTAQIVGEYINGTKIDVTAPVDVYFNGNEIVRVEFQDELNDDAGAAIDNVKNASVYIRDYLNDIVQDISIIPLIAPANGFGYSPSYDLPSTYAGVSVNFKSGVDGEIPFTTFRQISIIKNPVRGVTTGDETDNNDGYAQQDAYDTLKSLTLQSPANNVVVGDIITGDTSGAKAYVDVVDSATIKYHQNSNSDVNMIPFGNNEAITNDAVTVGTIASKSNPEYTPESGEVLFLENREAIQRSSNQTEQVKIVIQL
jgi:hypothetical protein